MTRKEELLITCIQNLQRKINVSVLHENNVEAYISDEEFEKEIEENAFKYVINIKNSYTLEDEVLINEIVQETKLHELIDDLSYSDISELFSIDLKR